MVRGAELASYSVMNGLLLGIAAVLLHEMSHIIVAQLQGLRIRRLGICWKGPYIVRQSGSWQQNLRVSLAGPLVNLALALTCWHAAPQFALCNLVLGGFNLLPIPGSDGHRAWQLLPLAATDRVETVPPVSARE